MPTVATSCVLNLKEYLVVTGIYRGIVARCSFPPNARVPVCQFRAQNIEYQRHLNHFETVMAGQHKQGQKKKQGNAKQKGPKKNRKRKHEESSESEDGFEEVTLGHPTQVGQVRFVSLETKLVKSNIFRSWRTI